MADLPAKAESLVAKLLGGTALKRHAKPPHDWNLDQPDGSGCYYVVRIGGDDALVGRALDALASQGRKPALQWLDDGTWLMDCRDDNNVLTGGHGETRVAALFDMLGRLYD